MRSTLRSKVSGFSAVAIVAVVALAAFGATPAGAGPVNNSVQQVYHAGTATAPSTAITDYTGDLLSLQVSYVGETASEPTIGVDNDGTAFFAASALDVETSVTWGVANTDTMRSTDGGLTWQSVQNKVPVVGTHVIPANADPEIYVDPDTGRVFNIDLTAACAWLNYSDDKGETWTPNPLACGTLGYVNDHQTIVAAAPRNGLATTGYPKALYYCVNELIQTGCGRSTDGGGTFLPITPAYTVNSTCGGLMGHLAADPEGRIFLPSGNCANPWISISEDNGSTWTEVKVSTLGSDQSHTSVTSDKAGNLYYVWQATSGTKELPYMSVSTDHGATWGSPMMIAPPGVNQVNFPVMYAGDAGRIAINFPGDATAYASGPGAAWNNYIVISADALGADPTFLSASTDTTNPVHRGPCIGRCGGLWDFQDIVISAQGQAWAGATDDCSAACNTGVLKNDHTGAGLVIRQIGGPSLVG